MKNDFTFNDFLSLNDNDTDDWEWQNLTGPSQFQTTRNLLGKPGVGEWKMVSPKVLVIKNILSYSKALEVFKTRLSGTFNVVIN
jgi:hypothetical protein